METRKRFGFLPFASLFLMTVYLFMIVSYLFFMSGTPTASGGRQTSHFRRKTETGLTVQRIDRTVLAEKKPVNPGKISFILLHINVPVLPFKLAANSQFTGFLPDLHHVYLSNRIIRI